MDRTKAIIFIVAALLLGSCSTIKTPVTNTDMYRLMNPNYE